MNKEIVVLIGGPSSGKTTLIEALKEKGHTCYPEISREVIREAQEQGIEQLFLEKPLLFSELLLFINKNPRSKKNFYFMV